MSNEVKSFVQAIIFFVILLVIKFVIGYDISMVWITILTLAYALSEYGINKMKNGK